MTIFKNTFRIESARLRDWDYSNPWWYYITINTKDHKEWFGEIVNGKMIFNNFGKIVEEEWLKTKEIRKNIDLDLYVVMPNHLHGIIIINECKDDPVGRLPHDETLLKTKKETMQRIVSTTLKSNSLGSIIGQFKSICSKRIRSLEHTSFSWQSRYYDRIIRNEKELTNIRKYIEQNPMRWSLEKCSSENLYEM